MARVCAGPGRPGRPGTRVLERPDPVFSSRSPRPGAPTDASASTASSCSSPTPASARPSSSPSSAPPP